MRETQKAIEHTHLGSGQRVALAGLKPENFHDAVFDEIETRTNGERMLSRKRNASWLQVITFEDTPACVLAHEVCDFAICLLANRLR